MQQKLTLPSTSRSACIWMQQRRYTTFSEKISESDQNCVYRETYRHSNRYELIPSDFLSWGHVHF
ncbi:hypothetical protein HanRHA438_Chr14g0632971 [Helianthus annuus]|nr:hypothetical protein HanRHA438_Chr14g0632971 [Helianthus annuus]